MRPVLTVYIMSVRMSELVLRGFFSPLGKKKREHSRYLGMEDLDLKSTTNSPRVTPRSAARQAEKVRKAIVCQK